jgi:RNA recognition motif-containing protein
VSNLDFDTTEDQIREEFTKIGSVTDIRLVKDFKGRSKGFCYVELSTDVSTNIINIPFMIH